MYDNQVVVKLVSFETNKLNKVRNNSKFSLFVFGFVKKYFLALAKSRIISDLNQSWTIRQYSSQYIQECNK